MKLIYPALAQILWTFIVGMMMFLARRRAVITGEVKIKDVAVTGDAWPLKAKLASANFSNQFETPVLFYVLVMFAIQAGATGWVMTALAWTYVASRVAHTLVHTGHNRVIRRMNIYMLGLAALFAMLLGIFITLV